MAVLLNYSLASVSDVKESLGIASSDTTYDNLITRQINKATIAIENYCGRRFKETTYTQEQYNPTHINEFVLKQRPITDTQAFSLEVRTTGLNADNWETIPSDLYFVDNPSGVIYTLFRSRGQWKRFRATYSAGYADIPADLAEACVGLACYWTNNADASDIGVYQVKEGQRSKTFQRASNQKVDFDTLIGELGIDQILATYCNDPIMTDR